MTRTVLALVVALSLAACSEPAAPPAAEQPTAAAPAPEAAPPAPAAEAPAADPLGDVLAGGWRTPEYVARDQYRHPRETLEFFGIAPDQTVVEVTPGGGWYTEILAPYLAAEGRYIGMVFDPTKATSERGREYYASANERLREKLAGNSDAYGKVELVEVDPAAPVIGEAGTADLVLTFRNAHNWIGQGSAEVYFKAFHDVLKPGGVLGVVDHRAPEGEALDGSSGYVTEQQVIDIATAAGFEVAGRSEVNANPADTRDYEDGVWTLPPTLRRGDEDRQKYLDIGESDRMTLRFVKPAAAATEAPAAGGEYDAG